MKLDRYIGNPILEKNPKNEWEAGSVLNPGVIYDDGIFRMVYRATNDVRVKEKGGYESSIGYAESKDGINFKRTAKPLIVPDQEYEKGLGCEDPRVTKLGDTYYLYYTAVKGYGSKYYKARGLKNQTLVRIALATSKDFKVWEKHGIVGPNSRSKAAVLFPEKINGKYIWFFTWLSDSPQSTIMQVKYGSVDELVNHSKNHTALFIEDYDNNAVIRPGLNSYRGPEIGAVPIKTKDGWLLIYCMENNSGKPEWTIGAALLDLYDPRKVIGKTVKPLLKPEKKSELIGVVDNVTFPEGAVVVGDKLYVYYGGGDQGINLATCNLNDLLNHLKK